MRLALFDLDNTLLAGDSDHAWGRFLADIGAVDPEHYIAANERFYQAYLDGGLDIRAFCQFVFQPLAANPLPTLLEWREQFVRERIQPMIAPGTPELLARHRQAGDRLVIITATNRFVTEPIAALLGIADLLATEPEHRNGQFTGELAGIPCFQEGKIQRLQHWLTEQHLPASSMQDAWFYSDSRNDIPLLEAVGYPCAVDPDPVLSAHATAQGWPILSLR